MAKKEKMNKKEEKKTDDPKDNIKEYDIPMGQKWLTDMLESYKTFQKTANDMMNTHVVSQDQFFILNKTIATIGKIIDDITTAMVFVSGIEQTQMLIDAKVIDLKKIDKEKEKSE